MKHLFPLPQKIECTKGQVLIEEAKSPNSTRPSKAEWAKYLHCGVGAI